MAYRAIIGLHTRAISHATATDRDATVYERRQMREIYDPRLSPPKKDENTKARTSIDVDAIRPYDPSSFYDGEDTKRKKEEEDTRKRRKRVVREEDERESKQPDRFWIKSYRQQELFEAVDQRRLSEDVQEPYMYFCRQLEEKGGLRQYVGVRMLGPKDLRTFWKYYESLKERHYYELMREDTHCHLYFDVEFSKVSNPDVDGVRMMDWLVQLIVEELKATPEIDTSKFDEQEHIVELDSESETKFSRHLIIQLPDDQVFADNSHCAHFVRKLWHTIESRRGEDDRCDAMFLRKERDDVEKTEPFIDLGVYTRNRVFRLYLSNKHSEETNKPILKTTGRFWKSKSEVSFETFKRSLVSATCLILEAKVIRFEGVTHTSVLRGQAFQGYRTGSHLARTASEFNGNAIGPCPRTASFVCKDFDRWSGHGGAAVRSWTAFPEYGVLILNLFGNRFCENIERAHKSNNVMFVIDFRECAYYQRCHDPDCRGIRGAWHKLSEDVLDESHELLKLLYKPPTFDEIDDKELAAPTFDEIGDDELEKCF